MSAVDRYAGITTDRRLPEFPAEGAQDADAAKSDTTELNVVSRALWVGTGGSIKVQMHNGDVVTIPGVPDASMLPIRVRQVFSTGTTATGLVSFY